MKVGHPMRPMEAFFRYTWKKYSECKFDTPEKNRNISYAFSVTVVTTADVTRTYMPTSFPLMVRFLNFFNVYFFL